MTSNLFKTVCTVVIAAAMWTVTSVDANAAESQGWTCVDGENGAECCECSRSETLRVCKAATTSGDHSEKCGLDDESVCTGSCMLVIG